MTFEDWLKKANEHLTKKLSWEVGTGDVVTVYIVAGYDTQGFIVSGNELTPIPIPPIQEGVR